MARQKSSVKGAESAIAADSPVSENMEEANDEEAQRAIKQEFLSTLDKYENQQAEVERLRQAMARHFEAADLDDRQELVIYLYSKDPALRSITAVNFAQIDPLRTSAFDEGAKEKSLILARHFLRRGDFSQVTAPGWLLTLGHIGVEKDVPLLVSSYGKMMEGELKDSVFLQKTSMEALGRMYQRFPAAFDNINPKDITLALFHGLDSSVGQSREMSVRLLARFSSVDEFDEAFIRLLSGLPRTDRTAMSLGTLALGLMSQDPDIIRFITDILDASLKDADDQYIMSVLKEVTGHFVKMGSEMEDGGLEQIAGVMGRYFETFIFNRKEQNAFERMTPKEKIAQMIKTYHGEAQL